MIILKTRYTSQSPLIYLLLQALRNDFPLLLIVSQNRRQILLPVLLTWLNRYLATMAAIIWKHVHDYWPLQTLLNFYLSDTTISKEKSRRLFVITVYLFVYLFKIIYTEYGHLYIFVFFVRVLC